MRVAALYRYPVKAMLGESLHNAVLTDRGVAGDRAFVVVDRSDGKIATGKHPRKWGRLLELAATYDDGPGSPVWITFPDGTQIRSDGAIDAALTTFLGRDVTLTSAPPEGAVIEGIWPRAIEGLAPFEVLESMAGGIKEGDDDVAQIPLSFLAPPGTFFDVTTLHVLTTSTLDQLAALEPEADFDVRRYRPNVLVESDDEGFVENDWPGHTLSFGADAQAAVNMPTMRCVMTTLARAGMAQDRGSLQAIARHNRLDIEGMGTWACAGVYASVTAAGSVALGDDVTLA